MFGQALGGREPVMQALTNLQNIGAENGCDAVIAVKLLHYPTAGGPAVVAYGTGVRFLPTPEDSTGAGGMGGAGGVGAGGAGGAGTADTASAPPGTSNGPAAPGSTAARPNSPSAGGAPAGGGSGTGT
jgi:hypothetical protein